MARRGNFAERSLREHPTGGSERPFEETILSYVSDGIIGEGVNVGAGVIFRNYDGVRKQTTTLEDGVFIGSDSQLVAPFTVRKGGRPHHLSD